MSDQQPVFSIEKLYVKDLSLEVPNAPQIFIERETPEIEIQLQSGANGLGDDLYEAVLTVTVTAKRDDTTYFLVEVAKAGVFMIKNIPETELAPVLGIACPNILFPYAREVVSDAVSRAGFPPVVLAPVNFEALYQQRVMEQQQMDQQGAELPIQ